MVKLADFVKSDLCETNDELSLLDNEEVCAYVYST